MWWSTPRVSSATAPSTTGQPPRVLKMSGLIKKGGGFWARMQGWVSWLLACCGLSVWASVVVPSAAACEADVCLLLCLPAFMPACVIAAHSE